MKKKIKIKETNMMQLLLLYCIFVILFAIFTCLLFEGKSYRSVTLIVLLIYYMFVVPPWLSKQIRWVK